jgi:hypothetical protein
LVEKLNVGTNIFSWANILSDWIHPCIVKANLKLKWATLL